MKKLFASIAIVFAIAPVYAGDYGLTLLKVRLADDAPITVSIDGRYYNKQGRALTIGDLPAGRHYIRIYRYLAYKDEAGGKAKTIYSGNIKLPAHSIVSLIYDARYRRMRVSSAPISEASISAAEADNETQEDIQGTAVSNGTGRLATEEITDLRAQVAGKITDTDKEKAMQNGLTGRSYTTQQVRSMLSWLSFESTRLSFAKWAYDGAVDKQNYGRLDTEFNFSGSKKELKEFLDTKKQ